MNGPMLTPALLASWLGGLVASMALAGAAEVRLPQTDPALRIFVRGETFAQTERGAYDVLALEGQCVLQQGTFRAQADEIVLWVDRQREVGNESPAKVLVLLSGNVQIEHDGFTLQDDRWVGRLFSVHAVELDFDRQVTRYDIPYFDWGLSGQSSATGTPPFGNNSNRYLVAGTAGAPDGSAVELQAPPLLNVSPRLESGQSLGQSGIPTLPGATAWDSPSRQIAAPTSAATLAPPITPQVTTGPNSRLPTPQTSLQPTMQPPVIGTNQLQAIQFYPRGSIPPEISFQFDASRGESIGQIKGGFKLVVQPSSGVGGAAELLGNAAVTLEADNAVVWVRSDSPMNLESGFVSSPDRPIELYLEGNIVFSQGNRVIYADRMYYNIASQYGMVLSAEVLTPVPQYQGLLRLKADVLQQLDAQNMRAYGAAVTSSRLGVPRYWLQSQRVEFQDQRTASDLTAFSPIASDVDTGLRASARGNHVYFAGIPVFYWPTIETDLREPSFYVTSIKAKNDTIFGTQVFVEWDAYQLLGIRPIEGTRLRLSTDYLSDRGPAAGYRLDFNRPLPLFGIPAIGFSDAWFIADSGRDNLGLDRSSLTPEESTRGRSLARTRMFFSPDTVLSTEVGWISDRNFLEQYFENEWEQEKDLTTGFLLSNYQGNRLLDIRGQARINEFFTESEWLPRLDYHWLAQDLWGGRATWNAKASIGYAHQRVATTPIDPVDASKFALLPWETDSEGLRALTRQELSLPLQVGGMKVVPYVSGEAGYWKEDVSQSDVTRVTGQAGVRTTLPLWRVYPNVENRLFDLRGLAHKVSLESDFFYADSSRDLSRFPLYDPLDDNAQEHFRRRMIFNTFGGTLPPEFDERGYALRSGMQRWVTAGSPEVVDDLLQWHLSVNNRIQTKRGLPGRERIVDLVSFNAGLIYFPRAQRDNFGEDVGGFRYDFRYHIGDRVTFLSDGYADVFSQGLKTVSGGFQISRPGRGDAYIGMLSLEGPISANVLNGYVNYRMNEKWIFNGGAAFDFARTGSIGQSLALTRVGESALVRLGLNIDHGRDNVSFTFNIEPRFLPTVRLGSLGGELIPPAGAYGVE